MAQKPAGSYTPGSGPRGRSNDPATPYTSLVNDHPPPRYPESPELDHRRSQDMTTGYQYSLAVGAVENYGAAAGAVPTVAVNIVGSCPACRVGVLDDHFTCGGILCAIFLFPIGIICCLGSRKRRCSNCGAVFG
ncbi:hypothetical protein BV898_13499 [Hypsibius exemplaris]|uniref:Membrane protein BRI3 n=1 Tax=Hypsibius exemplaris TaxID=2072580 RepID=A0A1W0WAN7_HYPEX|nr:hypothetical protein BV898_13499 [Hypsibius exemplaris]